MCSYSSNFICVKNSVKISNAWSVFLSRKAIFITNCSECVSIVLKLEVENKEVVIPEIVYKSFFVSKSLCECFSVPKLFISLLYKGNKPLSSIGMSYVLNFILM